MGRWEEVQHTADVALHVWGDDLADLFSSAAVGMFSLLVEAGDAMRSEAALSLVASDVEALLVDWLNELLYLYERDGAVFTRVTFAKLTPTELVANVTGTEILQPRAHIKAVTYHMVSVIGDESGVETEIVFDV